MGESVSFSRFVGLEINDPDENFLKTVKALGLNFHIHFSPMGETPCWLILADAKSVCQLSYSRWDGHGGGAEDYDYHADPFDKEMQKERINHDTKLLQDYVEMMDNHNIKHGDIVHVLGWTDTWQSETPADLPVVHGAYPMEAAIVSYGPWVIGEENHPDSIISEVWWELWVVPSTELIELPYGKETCKGKPAIPIRSKEEAERLWDEHREVILREL